MTKLRNDVQKRLANTTKDKLIQRKRIQSVREMKVDGKFRKQLESHNIDTKKLIEREIFDIKKDIVSQFSSICFCLYNETDMLYSNRLCHVIVILNNQILSPSNL